MAKECCAMCGEKHKVKEMFAIAEDSPLLTGVAHSGELFLCDKCNFRYNYIYQELYKKYDVGEAWKFFGAQEITLNSLWDNEIIRNFRRLMSEKMGGYANYNVFQAAMNDLYTQEGCSIVAGYFAANAAKKCFSLIRNDHIGAPCSGESLISAQLVEDGDDEYVKECSIVFNFSNKASERLTFFSTTGISRQSTIYKETMDTYRQIMELCTRLN